MNPEIDYPNIRATEDCPLCHKAKDLGLVACWPCHRAHLRNGTSPSTRYILDSCEALIARGGSVTLHWSNR